MKIEKNKVVEIVYEMAADGETVERCTEESPFDFIFGTGSLLGGFEDRIAGMEAGQEFDFELSAAEGHGEYDPARVIELPKEAFVIDGEFREDLIRVGNVIPLMGSDGVVVRGVISGVTEEAVTIDTNNRFAGKKMAFRGRILSVREATEQELAEGLHGELARHCGGCHGGHHHGGCHGGHGNQGCGHHGDGNNCCYGDAEDCGHHGDGKNCCHGGDDEDCEHHDEGKNCCHGDAEDCGHHRKGCRQESEE